MAVSAERAEYVAGGGTDRRLDLLEDRHPIEPLAIGVDRLAESIAEGHAQLGADTMREAITERTRIAIVCNPNNPTGTSVGAEAGGPLLVMLVAAIFGRIFFGRLADMIGPIRAWMAATAWQTAPECHFRRHYLSWLAARRYTKWSWGRYRW